MGSLPESLGYGSGMTCWRRLRIVVDARGIALVILVSGANRHDTKMFEKCVGTIPAIAGLTGHPRKRPAKLRAYEGYDFKQCRAHLRQRGMIG